MPGDPGGLVTDATGAAAQPPVRLVAGDPAPGFRLPDQTGSPVSLADYRGRRVLVYFYGEASTPACTAQACDFRDELGDLSAAGYAVVGISRDPVPALERFAREQRLPFPLLSDVDRSVHERYGAFGEKTLYGRTVRGVIRSTFAIDESGRIALPLYNIRATGHVRMLRRKLGV